MAYHDTVSPISAALGAKCPRCGVGSLFRGYLTVVDRCDHCGLRLAENDSGDGRAVFMIFILGFLAVPFVLWIEARWAPAIWVHALAGGGLVFGLTAVLLRPIKAYMTALQFRYRRSEFERGAGDDDGT
jgi:uncharacterized protein (DUF983 family)